MSHNTFGHLFRMTSWGESHGPSIGCVVDGCPPGLQLTEADIQVWLDKRRPGQGKFVTQRQEPDAVKILSGDEPANVAAIARDLALSDEGEALHGRALRENEQELTALDGRATVGGRVSQQG